MNLGSALLLSELRRRSDKEGELRILGVGCIASRSGLNSASDGGSEYESESDAFTLKTTLVPLGDELGGPGVSFGVLGEPKSTFLGETAGVVGVVGCERGLGGVLGLAMMTICSQIILRRLS